MPNRPLRSIFACLCGASMVAATPVSAVTLDFSSGTYNNPYANSWLYEEDGFRVTASLGFSRTFGTYGPTLAWYNGAGMIRVEYTAGTFDLQSVQVPVAAYAGLAFSSPTGAEWTFGSATGTLSFWGADWTDISYFTVRTLTGVDMLTQLDNLVLYPREQIVATPLPPAMLLLTTGLLALATGARRR